MNSKRPERSSKRKARRDSVSSSLGEPEAASQRTENVPSISDRDFSEIAEKIEKSVGRRIKDAETGQREILKMIENLSSKIDSLSGHPPRSENPIVDLYEPENQASTSRSTTLNELHPSQGQHMVCRRVHRSWHMGNFEVKLKHKITGVPQGGWDHFGLKNSCD